MKPTYAAMFLALLACPPGAVAEELRLWLSASPSDPMEGLVNGRLTLSLPPGTSQPIYLWSLASNDRTLVSFSANLVARDPNMLDNGAIVPAIDFGELGESPVNVFGYDVNDGNDPVACGYRFEYAHEPETVANDLEEVVDTLVGIQGFTLWDLPDGTATGAGGDLCEVVSGDQTLGSPLASIELHATGAVGDQAELFLQIGDNGVVLTNGAGNYDPTSGQSLLVLLGMGDAPLQANTGGLLVHERGMNSDLPEALITIAELLPGDLNGDGAVDAADAAIMFGNWGMPGLGDLNDDGVVDAADAGVLFANWTGDTASPADDGPRAVPEPSWLGSVALSVAALTGLRRRRVGTAIAR